jgi:hypothetical protein
MRRPGTKRTTVPAPSKPDGVLLHRWPKHTSARRRACAVATPIGAGTRRPRSGATSRSNAREARPSGPAAAPPFRLRSGPARGGPARGARPCRAARADRRAVACESKSPTSEHGEGYSEVARHVVDPRRRFTNRDAVDRRTWLRASTKSCHLGSRVPSCMN